MIQQFLQFERTRLIIFRKSESDLSALTAQGCRSVEYLPRIRTCGGVAAIIKIGDVHGFLFTSFSRLSSHAEAAGKWIQKQAHGVKLISKFAKFVPPGVERGDIFRAMENRFSPMGAGAHIGQ